MQILLHILTHSLMRHESFFDIIEFMYKSTIKLQSKSLIKRFDCWMQKLLNCKVEKLNKKLLNFFDSRVACSILFIEF